MFHKHPNLQNIRFYVYPFLSEVLSNAGAVSKTI